MQFLKDFIERSSDLKGADAYLMINLDRSYLTYYKLRDHAIVYKLLKGIKSAEYSRNYPYIPRYDDPLESSTD